MKLREYLHDERERIVSTGETIRDGWFGLYKQEWKMVTERELFTVDEKRMYIRSTNMVKPMREESSVIRA